VLLAQVWPVSQQTPVLLVQRLPVEQELVCPPERPELLARSVRRGVLPPELEPQALGQPVWRPRALRALLPEQLVSQAQLLQAQLPREPALPPPGVRARPRAADALPWPRLPSLLYLFRLVLLRLLLQRRHRGSVCGLFPPRTDQSSWNASSFP
jgi:hypothetical protein